jgi:hypothetical protein
MGGDQLVQALTDRATEDRLGDVLRDVESEQFGELVDEVDR